MANNRIHVGMKWSRLLACGFCTFLCACSVAGRSAETDGTQVTPADAHESQANTESAPANPKCRDAVAKIDGNQVDKTEALKACQLLHEHLIKAYGQYDKLWFVSEPIKPYYFFKSHVEREISPTFVVQIPTGIVPKKDITTMQAFFKHIDILHAEVDPQKLAQMVYTFHAKDSESLVTEHRDPEHGRAEQNPPSWTKQEDGSATLKYDLLNTGRSTTVKACTVQIAPDYSSTFNCEHKK